MSLTEASQSSDMRDQIKLPDKPAVEKRKEEQNAQTEREKNQPRLQTFLCHEHRAVEIS